MATVPAHATSVNRAVATILLIGMVMVVLLLPDEGVLAVEGCSIRCGASGSLQAPGSRSDPFADGGGAGQRPGSARSRRSGSAGGFLMRLVDHWCRYQPPAASRPQI